MDKVKITITVLALLIVALCSAVEQPTPGNRGTTRVGSASREWIPAAAGFTKTGDLRPDLFTPGARKMLDDNRKANSTGCSQFLVPNLFDPSLAHGSLDDLVSASLLIVRGRLYQAEAGFYLNTPGALFTLLPDEVLKTDGRVYTQSALFVFIPGVTIQTPSGFICSKALPNTPSPAVGDEVLLFVSLPPLNSAGDILRVDTWSQVVVNHGGHIFAPAAIEPSLDGVRKPFASLDDLAWKITINPHLQDSPKDQLR
jgi:hypothetical protein